MGLHPHLCIQPERLVNAHKGSLASLFCMALVISDEKNREWRLPLFFLTAIHRQIRFKSGRLFVISTFLSMSRP